MQGVFAWRWVADPWRRRGLLALIAIVMALLAVFPRPYLASTLLAPDDSAAGLSGLFGGGGGGNLLASLLGGRGTIEADLLIGRSEAVISEVARELHAQGCYRRLSQGRLEERLRHKVDIEAVRGSILQISTLDHDPKLAQQTIEDFVTVLRSRLTALSREQAVQKRSIARERMDQATVELDRQQRAVNAYRAAHRFTGPDVQIGATIRTAAELQGELQASENALLSLEKIEGPQNVQVQTLRDRIAVLEQQISAIQSRSAAGGAASLAQLNPELTAYQNLMRDERYAEAQYDIYRRYLEALTVQEVAAPLNMDVIDPPFIDPGRHFNAAPMGALVLVLLAAIVAEFYLARPAPRAA